MEKLIRLFEGGDVTDHDINKQLEEETKSLLVDDMGKYLSFRNCSFD